MESGRAFRGFLLVLHRLGRVIAGWAPAFRPPPSCPSASSEGLKRRGFKFVGPTITYAWMQAVGIVNDHSLACFPARGAVSGQPE